MGARARLEIRAVKVRRKDDPEGVIRESEEPALT